MPHQTAFVTVLLLLEYYLFALPIYAARRRTGIRAPAMHGHPDLDRAVRVHLNTLEKLAFVLPLMWVAAGAGWDAAAAGLGGAWGLSRVVYAVGYLRSPEGRTAGAVLGDGLEVALLGLAGWAAMGALSRG